jgi:hypothetical protein
MDLGGVGRMNLAHDLLDAVVLGVTVERLVHGCAQALAVMSALELGVGLQGLLGLVGEPLHLAHLVATVVEMGAVHVDGRRRRRVSQLEGVAGCAMLRRQDVAVVEHLLGVQAVQHIARGNVGDGHLRQLRTCSSGKSIRHSHRPTASAE